MQVRCVVVEAVVKVPVVWLTVDIVVKVVEDDRVVVLGVMVLVMEMLVAEAVDCDVQVQIHGATQRRS